ncbi:hypothetical protein FOA52_014986 [Chlamydomonas sp. UWO 241]|nr:hypothetical protein FOA52_014986 [Chlamydomonas sp. UWO 241]
MGRGYVADGAALAAEKTKREDKFFNEIDFVTANVIMALIADFMLTWLPAPTLSLAGSKAATGMLGKMFAGCPDNAFQKVQPGMDHFGLGQRFGAVIRNGLKLMGVGFGASIFGVGITNGIGALKAQLDPTYKSANAPQDVLTASAAYGVYMSISSNLRYQIIAGIIEERGIEVVFKGNHTLCHVLSFLVRTGNTFVGSLLWVDFARLLGMQKSTAPKAVEAPPAKAAKGGKEAASEVKSKK